MRKIDDLIDKTKKYKKITVQKNLKSKKNTVAYITINDKSRVLKWFVPGLKRNMKNEYKVLEKAKLKLDVPIVYEKDEKNNVLLMNYIAGENLSDIINSYDTSYEEKKRLMILLSKWFYKFHNFFKIEGKFLIHGDSNLRNFIFTDRIYGTDFEETRNGEPSEDIAVMCASILSSDPMFTKEKIKLCSILIDEYIKLAPGRITNINNAISYAILQKIQWRPKQEKNLREYSQKIRKKGIR